MSVFPSWAGPFDTFESCSLDNLFLNTAGVATIFFFFFRFCCLFAKNFEVSQFARTTLGIFE